jgi:hypothetical protein
MRWAGIAVTGLFLATAAPAHASHLQPSGTIAITDLGPAPPCTTGAEACGPAGTHRVRLDWSASCGPNAGGVVPRVSPDLMIVPKRAGAEPKPPPADLREGQPAGSEEQRVLPGTRVAGYLAVDCESSTVDADGNEQTEHRTNSATSSGIVLVAPRLQGFRVNRTTFCNVPRPKQSTSIQAKQFSTLDWELSFNVPSLVTNASSNGLLKGVRLRAAGAGMRLRTPADAGPVRKYFKIGPVFRSTAFPWKPGTLRIWAEIEGVKTNVVKIRVLPLRGRCQYDPRKYYGDVVMNRANPFVKN